MVILHPVVVLLALFGSGTLANEDDHCRTNAVDVTLILDTSNAVNKEEILNMIDFSMDLVKGVKYAGDAVQIAVIKLSTTARIVFPFVQNNLDLWDEDQILNMIDGMATDTSNSQGLTGLANALDKAVGLTGRRQGVHDVTIVMTAGADSRNTELETNANLLKGISEVFVIGFGSSVDNDQLNVMATNPLANIRMEEFLILDSVMGEVVTYLCPSCSCPDGQVCERITDNCITPVANCDSFPCDDNAFCTETVSYHTCVCHGNTIYNIFFGCFSPLPCVAQKGELCGENEVCKDITEAPLYQCECAPGYTGVAGYCNELTCFHETPCDRNALCVDNPDLSYYCECIPPFLGPGTPGNCISCGDEHVRLVLVVDNAKGPDHRHFDLIQVFLMELVDLLTISGNAMAVSVIQTTPSKELITFDDFVNDKRGLINALSNIDQVDGESDMVGALDRAQSILPAPEEGDPRNAVIILTSSAGSATSQALQETSEAEVFVIGLGSKTPALKALASDVDEFIRVEELTALIDITAAVRDLLCPPCGGGCGDKEVCNRAFNVCVPAVNECNQEECQEFSFCTELPLAESPTCSCRYQFVRFKKTDQDQCYSPSTCLKGEDDCHENGICEDSWIPGEYSCRCKHDYVGDGRNCTVIPCSASDTYCDPNADCAVVDDAASCTCKTNYQGNGVTCTAEPCSSVDTTCDENADCEKVGDEAHCTCKQDYTGDGTTCTLVTCSDSDPSCDENAECGIVNGSPVCTCKPNYSGNGQTCTVIPCTAADTTCDVNAECEDQDGTSVCTCVTNYRGNGTHCTPEPCGPEDTKCDQNAICTVEDDQTVCTCGEYYEGNGETCSIMPCSDFFNPCSPFATCIYENVAVSCTCARGYTGNGYYCTVIPCGYADQTCDENAQCDEVGGEVYCTCNEHYEGNGFSCAEDPCSALFSPCSENAACSSENGAAICWCLDGYEGNGIDCTEDPCSALFSPCSENAACLPENGAAICWCLDGYEGDGIDCTEIPCSPTFSPCATHASCTPENGKARCSCEDGYDGDGVTCEEDPCSALFSPCSENAACSPENGGAICTCLDGYEGNGIDCTEIPCSPTFSPCATHASCTPENGKARCSCEDGYDGDGVTCEEDPCSALFSPCSENAACSPENGGAICTCLDGYEGNGIDCTEMPCSPTFSQCSTHASCTPQNGIAMCTCEVGYDGDGVTCEANPCVYDTHDCDHNAVCISTNLDPYHNCICNDNYYGWGYSGLCHHESLLTGCQAKDVIFLIKTTLSMNLDMAIKFAEGVVSILPPAYRVAIMSYTYECVVVKPFNDAPHSQTAAILGSMHKTNQLVPGYHHVALQDVIDLLVLSSGDRPDVDNVVIVLTHGPIIYEDEFTQAVSNLKAEVSRVMFVGVEAFMYGETLSRMASDGESNVFNIENWEDITFNMESVTSSLVCPNIFEEYLAGKDGSP